MDNSRAMFVYGKIKKHWSKWEQEENPWLHHQFVGNSHCQVVIVGLFSHQQEKSLKIPFY